MSEENAQIVRRLYEAIDRGDTEAVLEAYDPDVEWHFARSPFRPLVRQDTYHGRDGIRSFIRERYEDAWRSARDELEELIDVDDERVVAVIKSEGRGRASGVPAEMTHAGIWTIRDDKVLRVEWMSREQALAEAGRSD